MQQILEATGRRRYHVHAPVPNDIRLLARIHSADAQHDPHLRHALFLKLDGEPLDHLVRLPRELARRTQDEPNGTFAAFQRHPPLLHERRHDHREDEGERLPGTRECDTDDISPGENHGQPLDLNRRRSRDTLTFQLVEDGIRELHLLEGFDGGRDIDPLDDDVPLFPEFVALRRCQRANVRGGLPTRLDGLRVLHILGDFLRGHQRLLLVDGAKDLRLLLRESLRGRDGVGSRLEPRRSAEQRRLLLGRSELADVALLGFRGRPGSHRGVVGWNPIRCVSGDAELVSEPRGGGGHLLIPPFLHGHVLLLLLVDLPPFLRGAVRGGVALLPVAFRAFRRGRAQRTGRVRDDDPVVLHERATQILDARHDSIPRRV